MSKLATARSFLFVPANRSERFAKALASGADAVILDLEDAVSAADKRAAAEHARLVVRINASGTLWHDDDLLLLRQLTTQGLAAVMVPKAQTVEGLQRVAHR